jgi:hypothetical protein
MFHTLWVLMHMAGLVMLLKRFGDVAREVRDVAREARDVVWEVRDVAWEVRGARSGLDARIVQQSQFLEPSRSAADHGDHSRWRSDLEKVGHRAERTDT